MPYREFIAAYEASSQDPVIFKFMGEQFECMLEPTLGDIFELMEAPEPVPETLAQSAKALAKFIRRMLVEGDKQRWDDTLYRVGNEGLPALVELGMWLAEVYTAARPSEPPSLSSVGRSRSGQRSKRRTGGAKAS